MLRNPSSSRGEFFVLFYQGMYLEASCTWYMTLTHQGGSQQFDTDSCNIDFVKLPSIQLLPLWLIDGAQLYVVHAYVRSAFCKYILLIDFAFRDSCILTSRCRAEDLLGVDRGDISYGECIPCIECSSCDLKCFDVMIIWSTGIWVLLAAPRDVNKVSPKWTLPCLCRWWLRLIQYEMTALCLMFGSPATWALYSLLLIGKHIKQVRMCLNYHRQYSSQGICSVESSSVPSSHPKTSIVNQYDILWYRLLMLIYCRDICTEMK